MEEIKQVYIVIENHPDRDILGVFRDKQAAIDFCAAEKKRLNHPGNAAHWQSHDLI